MSCEEKKIKRNVKCIVWTGDCCLGDQCESMSKKEEMEEPETKSEDRRVGKESSNKDI